MWESIPRPEVSAVSRSDPDGCRASLDIGVRCVKGRVVDLSFTRSKMVTRLPTGEIREEPSGVKVRFPLPYTVPNRLANWKSVFIMWFDAALSRNGLDKKFAMFFVRARNFNFSWEWLGCSSRGSCQRWKNRRAETRVTSFCMEKSWRGISGGKSDVNDWTKGEAEPFNSLKAPALAHFPTQRPPSLLHLQVLLSASISPFVFRSRINHNIDN